MRILIKEELRGKVFIGVGVIKGINNRQYPGELENYIKSEVNNIRGRYTLEALKDDRVIRAYRDFYWHELGIDPTKQRPAQEALLRRILRGEGLPRINPMVDIGNVASIKYLVPVGLYDIGKFQGRDLVIRYAVDGETFNPIGSPVRKLTRNQIVLATVDNLILHIYPYRDSELTKIDENTRDVLIITAGVPGVDQNVLRESTGFIMRTAREYLGGEPIGEPILIVSEGEVVT
ncbi:B3/B4 domain-containing protein [Vulcanisaeta thermophila]|uniref:B3/B4 domain-containing protein n=1 Tax=Vulcanisaeta thermophila TaxID=867917 RepID=UPI0008534D79|nr:phenylalanine--tRNA ligase beta subunit-related protein [Vulcanisaeta thermophila]